VPLTDTIPARLTTGDVGRHFGVPTWAVRRLWESSRLPEPARVGSYRVLTAADLPAVEAALVAAGYLARGGAAPCV